MDLVGLSELVANFDFAHHTNNSASTVARSETGSPPFHDTCEFTVKDEPVKKTGLIDIFGVKLTVMNKVSDKSGMACRQMASINCYQQVKIIYMDNG